MPIDVLTELRSLAAGFLPNARTPYSGRQQAAAVLLSTGEWTAGVRVESASFSLVIPASLNALTTAAAAGRSDVVAAVTVNAATESDRIILRNTPLGDLTPVNDFGFAGKKEMPRPMETPLIPSVSLPETVTEGIESARESAIRAIVPASRFQVGVVVTTSVGKAVPGVNVEHPEWSFVLCAERNAIGTIVTHDLGRVETIYLTCLRDPQGTPCGACRQILSELAPSARLWMDRGEAKPESDSPRDLLPKSFTGSALLERFSGD